MKVKCIRLIDSGGREVNTSPWLKVGQVYNVLSIFIDQDGKRSYAIVGNEHEGEWPNMVSHEAECFEVVSTIVPSNWRVWIHESSAIGVSPATWQAPDFAERFYDRDPSILPIFQRERDIIVREES
ncbi:hypothetical protein [Dongia sp.]|uniref:hypothetical protein n=1 Tax=Dongia sp. TaxID=1977262 RepID=UPI0035AFA71D